MTERLREQSQRLTEGQLYTAMKALPDNSMVGTFAFREFFVGQEASRQQLIDVITKSPAGTVAIISEPLGSGKSALISMVRDDLIKGGHAGFEECLRTNAISLDEDISFEEFYWSSVFSDEKPKDWNSIKPKTLFIEEFDRKSSYSNLQKEMKSAGRFLVSDVPIIVLSGDYSLKNPELIKLINSPHEPIYISLDPLNPETLKKALELRLRYVLNWKDQKIDIDSLFDQEFLAHLIPATNPPTATMRTTLVILQEMAKILKPTLATQDQPARFSELLYRSRFPLRDTLSSNAKAWHFVSWLHGYINSHYNSAIPMEPITISEFNNLCSLSEIYDEEYPGIFKYLASSGILSSVGIPYLYDRNDKFPEPYLPSQETFLDAKFDPLPPKTPDEVREEEEIAAKKLELNRLGTLFQEGFIEGAIFFQQRNKLLGIDTLLDSFIEGRISKETFIERRQELLGTYGDVDEMIQ